ncbi:hypothetical protein Tco_1026491, partial [Tanacetum coccineum]
DFPDCEDSRARSFTLYPQEFHILSFILGIHALAFRTYIDNDLFIVGLEIVKNRGHEFIVRTSRKIILWTFLRFSFYDPNVEGSQTGSQEKKKENPKILGTDN